MSSSRMYRPTFGGLELPLPWEGDYVLAPPDWEPPTVETPSFVTKILDGQTSATKILDGQTSAATKAARARRLEQSRLNQRYYDAEERGADDAELERLLEECNMAEEDVPEPQSQHEDELSQAGIEQTSRSSPELVQDEGNHTAPQTSSRAEGSTRRTNTRRPLSVFDMPDSSELESEFEPESEFESESVIIPSSQDDQDPSHMQMDLNDDDLGVSARLPETCQAGTASSSHGAFLTLKVPLARLPACKPRSLIVKLKVPLDRLPVRKPQSLVVKLKVPFDRLPLKRKAEDEGRDMADTGSGRKKIISKPPSKKIARLIERGRYENRVWYLCEYEGGDGEEVFFQTALKKKSYLEEMIKAWDKQNKGR